MSSNIVTLIEKKPDEECVTFIESLLKLAKEGDIRHIAVVVQYHDRTVASAWSGTEGAYCTSMLGEMEVLKIKYYKKAIEGQ